ncbi:MAG TPA: NAD(P)H-hydrate dehydratase [Albitalea sp.]
MQRVLPPTRSLPLLGIERTRQIEAQAAASLPPHALMQRAGRAVARLGLAIAPHASTVWIAAGPGNNGGDGLDAAIHLRAAGKDAQVTLLGDAARLPADAADALQRAHAAGVPIVAGVPRLSPRDLAIDALLGIGAARPPDSTLAGCITTLNGLPCPVLAVDVPSGLDAARGRALGAQCVVAQHTLSLLSVKPGLFTGSGRDHAGTIWFDDLAVESPSDAPDAWLGGIELGQLPARAHAQHKGSFGDVAVVGGAPGMGGAALLAARAAHAAGAGRVYVDMLDEHAPLVLDSVRPELMFRTGWHRSDEATLAHSTVVCGCGGGDAVRTPLPRLLSAAARLVLDADALNAIAADSALQKLLRARASRRRLTMLTPHPLEAARLLSSDTAGVQGDRLAAAQALAERFSCVVLLKGSGSVIAAPQRAPWINSSGSAALASAGTGDVLAGWLGGLWAQQPAAASSVDGAQRVACSAAFQHGLAADTGGTPVTRAGDLIDRLHAAR